MPGTEELSRRIEKLERMLSETREEADAAAIVAGMILKWIGSEMPRLTTTEMIALIEEALPKPSQTEDEFSQYSARVYARAVAIVRLAGATGSKRAVD